MDINVEKLKSMSTEERYVLFEKMCSNNNIFDSATASYVMYKLSQMGYFTAPASKTYHGNYEGGLFDHSFTVATELLKISNREGYGWLNPRSPALVGLFHDLCKVDSYCKVVNPNDPSKTTFIYANNSEPSVWGKGHGSKSVQIASTFIRLTDEEVACIRYHMGAYETDDWGSFDAAIKKFPNVLWTHTADMVASKILGT